MAPNAAKVAPTRVTPDSDEGVVVARPKSQMNLSVGSVRAPPSGCVEKFKEWMRQLDLMDVLLDPYIKVTALPWKASKRTKALQNVSAVFVVFPLTSVGFASAPADTHNQNKTET